MSAVASFVRDLFSAFAEGFRAPTKRFQQIPGDLDSRAVDQQRLALMVGAVAIGLPTVTFLAGLLTPVCLYDSISHFYYSRILGAFFVGCLAFIGTYLIAWTGENGKERALGTFTAPFAYGIAIFPTAGTGCTEPRFDGRLFATITYAEEGATARPLSRLRLRRRATISRCSPGRQPPIRSALPSCSPFSPSFRCASSRA